MKSNLKNTLKLLLTTVFLAFAGLAVTGCEQEGPIEEAGEEVDEAVEEAGDEIEEATDEVEEEVDDMGN